MSACITWLTIELPNRLLSLLITNWSLSGLIWNTNGFINWKFYPKYDWLFVYDNSKGQLRTNYEIKAIPSYFLINPEGKFVQIPAESPEGDIDRAFYDIVKPKIKLHNVGSKRDY